MNAQFVKPCAVTNAATRNARLQRRQRWHDRSGVGKRDQGMLPTPQQDEQDAKLPHVGNSRQSEKRRQAARILSSPLTAVLRYALPALSLDPNDVSHRHFRLFQGVLESRLAASRALALNTGTLRE